MTDKLRQNPILNTYFYVSIIAPFAVALFPLTFSGVTEQSRYGDYVGTAFLFIMVLPFVALNALIANVLAIAVYKAKSYWAVLIIQGVIYGLTAYSMFGPSAEESIQQKAESDLESIYKSNAKAGREVPSVAFCPGKRMPDMTQSDFDLLPIAYRNLYRDGQMKMKLDFLCGQFLNQLLLNNDSLAGYGQEERVRLLDSLLNTKQVARNTDGSENWWQGAASLLTEMRRSDAIEASTRLEFYRVFEQKIFPHLTVVSNSDTNATAIAEVVKQAIFMPTEMALHVLKTFEAQGLLSKKSNIESSPLALEILHDQNGTIGEMPQPIFDYLLTESGPDAINDSSLMQFAVGQKNVPSVQRLLLAGANPAHDGLLAFARSAGWDSIIYQMLLSSALQSDKRSHAKPMLPPKEADLILREALKNCDGIDWKEIDFLAAHGADITRTFQNDPPQPIARFALECDKGFKSLVVRGLRMDAIYDDEPKVDKDEKVPLMLYFLYDPPTQRADVVEAMLRQSNNANGPPKCDPCDEYPLSLALTGDDSSIVRVLLKFGADPNKLDKSGEPSFLAAAVRNKVDLLDLMQSKANLNVNQKDESGISPLAWTICNNATDSADWLKRHGAISFGQDICEKEIAKKSDDAKQK